jgi:protease PrsW
VFLARVDFGGLQGLLHAFFSALFGAGLGMAVWSRSWWGRIGYPMLGLAGAMVMHALWNGLPQLLLVREYGFDTVAAAFGGQPVDVDTGAALASSLDAAFTVSRRVYYVGLLLVVIAFVLWLRYERQIIRYELAEEVRAGVLSQEELEILPRFWSRSRWYLQLLRDGRAVQMSALSRLHGQLVSLALLKWRARRRGVTLASLPHARAHVDALRTYISSIASPAVIDAAASPPWGGSPEPDPSVMEPDR